MTSLRATKINSIPPTLNGKNIYFYVQRQYYIYPQQSVSISMAHSINNIKQGYCLQLDASTDAVKQGLMVQKKQYASDNYAEQITAFVKNTSDTIVKIQKGFNLIKGILKAFGIDILEILPFLAIEGDTKKKIVI